MNESWFRMVFWSVEAKPATLQQCKFWLSTFKIKDGDYDDHGDDLSDYDDDDDDGDDHGDLWWW